MAVDFFLQLDGIKGEAKDQGHVGEIKIHSWSWGASQTTSVSGTGGSGAGKASLSDISIMKDYDKSSPPLFQALLKGNHIKTGVLTAQKSAGEGSGKPFLKISLEEIFVTSVQDSGSSEIPSESISFSYNKIKVEYFTQDETGKMASVTPVNYDLKANVVS
jgi:type VI secretion system secreted protein Hcp